MKDAMNSIYTTTCLTISSCMIHQLGMLDVQYDVHSYHIFYFGVCAISIKHQMISPTNYQNMDSQYVILKYLWMYALGNS